MSGNIRDLNHKCKLYKDCHIVFQTYERALLEGILLESDDESATLLSPEDLPAPPDSDYESRQGGETFRPRYRRYRRIDIPLSSIIAIHLFPYHYPSYPYIYQRNLYQRYYPYRY